MTHTPVPWRIEGRVYPTADLNIESQELGLRVVDCVCGASDEECCANAELICRAVNSHDDLLATCDETRAALDVLLSFPRERDDHGKVFIRIDCESIFDTGAEVAALRDKLATAIAKATKEA